MAKTTPDQQQIIDYDGNLLVIAVPGAGKTWTLVQRVLRLLEDPTRLICIVTFTNDAATEIRERIAKETTPENMRLRVQVQTFHTHAINMLKREGILGRGKGKVLSPQDQRQFLQRALHQSGDELSFEEAQTQLEEFKSNLGELPEDTPEYITNYQAMLKRARSMDLLDVVRDCVIGMRTGQIRRIGCTDLLVDEFQDTDRMQLEWVFQYSDDGVDTVVVGDDDQSIYAWRKGLGYPGMLEFQQRAKAQVVTLDINFRSNDEVLDVADKLILHNQERALKHLRGARGPGGSTQLLRPNDDNDEAWSIVRLVGKDLIPATPGKWYASDVPKGTWAVISRTNAHLWATECALRASGIRYCKPKKGYEPPHVSLLLALLTTVQDASPVGFELALQTLGLKNGVIQAIHNAVGKQLGSALDKGLPPIPAIEPADLKTIGTFLQQTKIWRQLVREGQYDLAISGVEHWICSEYKFRDKERDTKDVRTVATMLSRARGSLSQRVRTFQASTKQDKDEQRGGVELHTMHSAKGLEFNNVVIIQSVDGICPSSGNLNLEEERRLYYVAITRARDNLYASCSSSKPISPFVAEAQIKPAPLRAPATL